MFENYKNILNVDRFDTSFLLLFVISLLCYPGYELIIFPFDSCTKLVALTFDQERTLQVK